MKITKLVILFNYRKILLGIVVSIILFIFSFQVDSEIVRVLLRGLGILIVLNIIASLVASYILYDTSDLYELNDLKGEIDWSLIEKAVLIHASFDPLSQRLEEKYPHLNVTVCDIYGNRVMSMKAVSKYPKRCFLPTQKKLKYLQTNYPLKIILRM